MNGGKFVTIFFYCLSEDRTVRNGVHSKMDKEQPSAMTSSEKYDAKKSILILAGIFLTSLVAMFYLYLMFPELEE